MYKIVYNLPNNQHYAFISRSGSSSIALMIMNYIKHPLVNLYNDNYSFDSNLISPHRLMDYVICDKMPPKTITIIRNPIDRLRSLVCRTGIQIDVALAGLYWIYNIGNKPRNTPREWVDGLSGDALYHFRPISTIVEEDSTLLRFEDINRISDILNINTELPCVNKNILPLPIFSEEQIYNIKCTYLDDFNLYNLLT